MQRSGRFWFAFIFSTVLLLPGLHMTTRTIYCLLFYQRADGTANFEARGRRGMSRYKITFTAKDGRSYSLRESGVSFLGLGFEPGEMVKVIYPEDDPGAGLMATFYGLWF